ncbi:MBL fold metallo-hydrolase [Falsarthrobacter nasiphocae]|uniref:Ribonuclease BN (tRNA processing enzyme) n=1 Tax=Falsarthrobacter nasiphocae TaxID=189863 RepID=A0AAE3YIB2_9MICC|nr:MBL fold metallo-hydrolase [Falsarthrobacter nasiphocae]MDR6892797.1 ribonuclease BN (tRNA processing enzyme) [Falsarthrobacter nasiphocae]
MRLTVIGCQGSFPGPGSPASCYLVRAERDGRTWSVLFDLGSGALGALQRHLDLSSIDAIFLSHLHPDHCMDVCGLHVAVHWDPEGFRGERIAIHGPAETPDRLATAYGMPVDPGMHEDFDFRAIAAGEPVTVGPLTVEAFPVRHPVDEAYAFRITETLEDGALRVLTYSGDTDACEALEDAARGADVFLCEAAYHEGRDDAIEGVHLTGRRAGEAAARAGVGRLLLTHLPVWNDATRSVSEARGVFDGEIAVATAGVSYDV